MGILDMLIHGALNEHPNYETPDCCKKCDTAIIEEKDNNLELYDDRGLKIDHFKEILNRYKKLSVMISGGVDSSFTLWWFAKCIDELKLYDTHSILPMTGIEPLSVLPYCNINEVKQIIQIVKDTFPKVTILDHHTYNVRKGHKSEDNSKQKELLLKSGEVDHFISSVVAAPLFEDIELGFSITLNRSIEKQLEKGKEYIWGSPFGHVDKKFIAYQYKKYNLLDTIFALTKSCICPSETGEPCMKCSWCFEKYWAYEMYDNCIKNPEPIWERAKGWYPK
jgi:7-cyano-7-deazaguanine synthase in queuosine biosynthesis